MSSGFIIGQDVETLHRRESNQLRSSNDREYMEENAEQGDLIICSINYCVPDIFLKPSKSFQPIKCFLFPLGSSWTMTLVSNPDHSVSTDVLFRVRWVTICVRKCGVARRVDHYIGPMLL